jgi:hypothetical protein
MNYYIYSWKWSAGKDYCLFYRPDGKGYTANLQEAGIFGDEDEAYHKVIRTRKSLFAQQRMKKNESESFLIPVDKVEKILGDKKTIILR